MKQSRAHVVADCKRDEAVPVMAKKKLSLKREHNFMSIWCRH